MIDAEILEKIKQYAASIDGSLRARATGEPLATLYVLLAILERLESIEGKLFPGVPVALAFGLDPGGETISRVRLDEHHAVIAALQQEALDGIRLIIREEVSRAAQQLKSET